MERDRAILKDIDWTIRPGEHWVLLGANGSGKTSLLSALTGYLTPSAGEIELLGKRYGAADWRVLRQAVGLVSAGIQKRIEPEETALEMVASGRDAVLNFWGKLTPALRRQALRRLRQVDGAHLAARPWWQLSQGERQRVLIARAMMSSLKILILDEPCAGLDPVAREEFLGFLARFTKARGGPGLVLVTHHVEEIVPGFTHGLVLRQGKALASGKIGSVMTSRVLSAAFGAPCRIGRRGGRYAFALTGKAKTPHFAF